MAGQLGLESILQSDAQDSSLAAEVLQVSGILAQDVSSRDGGPYIFQREDGDIRGRFELTRDDTLHLIGLLNSPEVDIAKRELGVLLGRLDRSAVEGLTRRLVSALRQRTTEMEELEESALSMTQRSPLNSQGLRRKGPPVRREPMQPQMERRAMSAEAPVLPSGLSKSKSEEQFVNSVQRPPVRRQMSARGPVPSADVPDLPGMPPRPSRAQRRAQVTKSDDMPQVFRRLTAPYDLAGMPGDEVVRAAQAAIENARSVSTPPPMTVGGIPTDESGPHASAYLEALLEAHEGETGLPATSSRRSLLAEEMEESQRRHLRVPEEEARRIFDRLYKSGKEHRVRKRVYHELGLLVEQAKEQQMCTFEPSLPLAAHRNGMPAEPGSVTDRLYNDGLDRIRRREEMMQSAPVPCFHPQTLDPVCLGMPQRRRVEQGFQDSEGADAGTGEMLEDECQEEVLANFEPAHIRLHREHENRLARRKAREQEGQEWRKHTYRPNITSSQTSGPQVVRSSSYGMMLQQMPEDEYLNDLVATAEDQEDGLGELPMDSASPRTESDDVPVSEALLLLFTESRMPVPETFEEELLNALALLGAEDCLEQVMLRFLPGECIIAALQGPHDALIVLRDLRLFDLTVSGFRVGEVRWTTIPVMWPADKDRAGTNDTLPPPPIEDIHSARGMRQSLGASSRNSRGGSPPRSPQASGGMPSFASAPQDSSDGYRNAGGLRGALQSNSLGRQGFFTSDPPQGSGSTVPFVIPPSGAPSELSRPSLSREASATTFGTGIQRQFSGRITQVVDQPSPGLGVQRRVSTVSNASSHSSMMPASMHLTPAAGGVLRGPSGGGVRYPAELASMPSGLTHLGMGNSGAFSPRVSTSNSTPQSSFVGQPIGTPSMPQTGMWGTQSLAPSAYGGFPMNQPLRTGRSIAGPVNGSPMYGFQSGRVSYAGMEQFSR